MRIIRNTIPIKGDRSSTTWFGGTSEIEGTSVRAVVSPAVVSIVSRHPSRVERVGAVAVFLLASAATLTIGSSGPWAGWAYEALILAWLALILVRQGWVAEEPLAGTGRGVSSAGHRVRVFWNSLSASAPVPVAGMIAISALSLWGFAELALGATVYRWATFQAALENAALGATAAAGFLAFRHASVRAAFLRALVWFGVLLSVASVVAYFTSPGRILWIFPSPYPDNWGPFLSRNNFAQFLELCYPVALYRMASREPRSGGGLMLAPAVLLAAGLGSASRAGAALLLLETVAVFALAGKRMRRRWLPFAAVAAGLATLAGAGTLLGRLSDPDPFQYRREIFRSAEAMISQRPWSGYGLGTFSTVYPQFAEFDSGSRVEHAHNDWLQWAAEGGIPFAVLWALIAVWALRPAVRSVWGIGILALFLHALVDYPFARLGVVAWAFLLLAALAREKTTPEFAACSLPHP
jgi:O-antigen ligase